jgi:hypothetical protein
VKATKSIACIFIFCAGLFGKEFTDQWTHEIGGVASLSLQNKKSNNNPDKISYFNANINPFYHFFIIKYIYLGPAISYSYERQKLPIINEEIKKNTTGLGIDLGIATPATSFLTFYFQLDYSFGLFSYELKYFETEMDWRQTSLSKEHLFSADLGFKVIIYKRLALNVSTGYTFATSKISNEGYSGSINDSHGFLESQRNIFRLLNIGFSGLLFKADKILQESP